MMPLTIDDCWRLAIAEADRYTSMLTDTMSGVEKIKYTAKRDQSTRIARLIKLGNVEVRP